MTGIDELLTLCRQWAEREDEVTVVEALTLLTEFYMEQCGVSLTQRTLVNECGEYWLYKLSLTDHPLAERVGKDSFTQLMPHFSEEFARNKQHYGDYDISNLYEDSMVSGMTEIMTDECLDDKLRIAFACGFIEYYKEYKEFERTYNRWIQTQNKEDGNEN
ncbi:MAG: hypothetical protein K2N28_07050 [Muribaculaceae bacterium]|nr:hypothetical protein [Muribaculaceae bacterium]